MIFETLDHREKLLRVGLVGDRDGILRDHLDLHRVDVVAVILQRFADLRKHGGVAGDFKSAVLGLEVVCARVDGRHHESVLVDAFARYFDDALAVEVPCDAAHLSDSAARLREERAHLRRGAVAVVGHDLDHDGDAVRPVAFIEDDLHLSAELAGAALDSALDVVHGDVARAGSVYCDFKAEVRVRVSAAGLRGRDYVLYKLLEGDALLSVLRCFAVFDTRPM